MKTRYVVLLFGLTLFMVACLSEESARKPSDSKIFTDTHVAVKYTWTNGEPLFATNDPVNVGSVRKWFGFAKYDTTIILPSSPTGSNPNGFVDRRKLVSVTPVAGATYECTDHMMEIMCTGPVLYKIDPGTVIMINGRVAEAQGEYWNTNIRSATIMIHKFL